MFAAGPELHAGDIGSQPDPGRTSFHVKRRIDYWVGGFLLLLLFPVVRLLALVLRRDHSLDRRRGCVVIKLVGAGSLFLAMPSLQAIRRKFPPGSFYLVGTPPVASFAQSCGWFDACWVIDDSSLCKLVASTLRVLWNVARHTDHLIDLEVHSRLTTVLSLLTMVRNRIGFVDEIVFWRRGFYTHTTWFNTHGPTYAFYDLLAQWFGIQHVAVSGFHASFRAHVHSVTLPGDLALPPRYVAIGHGCSDLARERQLRPEEWGRVLRPLALLGCQFVFLGGAADAPLADQAIAVLGSGRNLCGELTLMQSARAIAGATCFYGIDSMLLHLARALGVETTSFWGPTNPASLLRPMTTPERVVFAHMPCAPCVHVNETPPCQGRRDCIAQAVSRVVGGLPQGDQSATSVTGWRIGHDRPAATPVSISYA
jgi:ADP-heptose:LPS heptosyltransferase